MMLAVSFPADILPHLRTPASAHLPAKISVDPSWRPLHVTNHKSHVVHLRRGALAPYKTKIKPNWYVTQTRENPRIIVTCYKPMELDIEPRSARIDFIQGVLPRWVIDTANGDCVPIASLPYCQRLHPIHKLFHSTPPSPPAYLRL